MLITHKVVKKNRKRLKIYYLLAKNPTLIPSSGDRISELNIINSISKFADVYYNNKLYREGKPVGGGASVGVPRGDCDLYYIRANPKIARLVPEGKLVYFATPFCSDVFEKASAITTYTDSWTKDMKGDFEFTGDIYKEEYRKMIMSKNVHTINQVVDPIFYKKNIRAIKEIRAQVGGGFVLGAFGRVAKSCYPHLLFQALPEIKKHIPNFKILYATSEGHAETLKLDPRFSGVADSFIFKRFAYKDMPSVIGACDASFYPYVDVQGHFAGSMKVLESMAAQVPVIAPAYNARKIELGDDYPLFLESATNIHVNSPVFSYPKEVVDEFVAKLILVKNISFRARLGKELYRRSTLYDVEHSAQKLKKTFYKIMDKSR